jgi:hypothetical protein
MVTLILLLSSVPGGTLGPAQVTQAVTLTYPLLLPLLLLQMRSLLRRSVTAAL